MSEPILTTVVGSYPQPEWLVDRDNLRSRLSPRIRAREIWRIAEPLLEQAQDDATLGAIREMERAGVNIISDGEIRRESHSKRFATALEGVDLDRPGTALDRTGHPNPVARVVGEEEHGPHDAGQHARQGTFAHVQPDQGDGDRDHRQIDGRELLVAHRHAKELLETVDATLHLDGLELQGT